MMNQNIQMEPTVTTALKEQNLDHDAASSESKREEEEEEEVHQRPRPRRKLRKRTKTRGHGTVNEHDVANAKYVDLEDFNLWDNDISNEFGEVHELPQRFKHRRSRDICLKSREDRVEEFQLTQGQYTLNVEHISQFSNLLWLGNHRAVVAKVWIRNRKHNWFTLRSANQTLTPSNNKFQIHFTIETSEPISLIFQLTSQSRLTSNLKFRLIKRKSH